MHPLFPMPFRRGVLRMMGLQIASKSVICSGVDFRSPHVAIGEGGLLINIVACMLRDLKIPRRGLLSETMFILHVMFRSLLRHMKSGLKIEGVGVQLRKISLSGMGLGLAAT